MPPIAKNTHSCNHCQRLLLKSPIEDHHNYEFDFSLADILQALLSNVHFVSGSLTTSSNRQIGKMFAEKPETH